MSAMASQSLASELSLSGLFKRSSKKTSKLCVSGLFEENPPVIGGFPTQRDSNAEMFPFDDVIMNVKLETLYFLAIIFILSFFQHDNYRLRHNKFLEGTVLVLYAGVRFAFVGSAVRDGAAANFLNGRQYYYIFALFETFKENRHSFYRNWRRLFTC